MKKYIIALLVIILTAGLAFISLGNGKTKAIKAGGILSVNDIQADPSAYKGAITITGVVAKRHPSDPRLFAIIETAEAKLCKSTGCAKFYLPVQYEGKAPQEWDEVNVTGSFAEDHGLFIASKTAVLRHLTFK
ncbi:MAG: hypothetical protein M1510_00475 [Nitrospirae bacterium]|nr:hypothetical protein [Nitrospirota bacterium]